MANERRGAAHISGWGRYAPGRVLTNDELSRMVDTSDEWIGQRTGILDRRVADSRETTAVQESVWRPHGRLRDLLAEADTLFQARDRTLALSRPQHGSACPIAGLKTGLDPFLFILGRGDCLLQDLDSLLESLVLLVCSVREERQKESQGSAGSRDGGKIGKHSIQYPLRKSLARHIDAE